MYLLPRPLVAHTPTQTKHRGHSLSSPRCLLVSFWWCGGVACGPWQCPAANRWCGNPHTDQSLVEDHPRCPWGWKNLKKEDKACCTCHILCKMIATVIYRHKSNGSLTVIKSIFFYCKHNIDIDVPRLINTNK